MGINGCSQRRRFTPMQTSQHSSQKQIGKQRKGTQKQGKTSGWLASDRLLTTQDRKSDT